MHLFQNNLETHAEDLGLQFYSVTFLVNMQGD